MQARAVYDSRTGKLLYITDMSTQDTKHKGKRLDMPLQSSAKTMLIGNYCASAIDLFLVRNYFDDEQVRNLRISDLRRDDRQNFAAVVRRSGKLVIGILKLMQDPAQGGHQTQGTVAVYTMISKYMLIFLSRKLTFIERIENAAYVVHFLRLWHVSTRSWPDQKVRNCKANFYPFQTFRHVILSCQSAVIFIMACSILTPHQVCGLRFLGSDCCEILFSILGGWGGLTSWQRNFAFGEAVRKVTDSNALTTIRHRGSVKQQTHRNDKAGEFNHKLHEDMEQEDADLTAYPTTAEMLAAWHRGQTAAANVCIDLGVKHAAVTDAMWNRPWEFDPENPPVTECDEYMRRKFGDYDSDYTDSDSDSCGSSDSDDDDDDADLPELVEVEDDDNVVQVQLDYAINEIERAVNGGDDGEDDTAPDGEDVVPKHMIRTPNGRLISKETAICMLREAFDDRGVISKDRLRRIQQCAQRSRQDVEDLSENEDLSLELHKDVAFAFDQGRGKPFDLWFGRVQKMVVTSQTGRRSLRLGSIPLENLPKGLSVMCTFYKKVPRQRRTYRYGAQPLETTFYPAETIICVVQFEYNSTHKTYTVPTDQWTHIRDELRRLERSR